MVKTPHIGGFVVDRNSIDLYYKIGGCVVDRKSIDLVTTYVRKASENMFEKLHIYIYIYYVYSFICLVTGSLLGDGELRPYSPDLSGMSGFTLQSDTDNKCFVCI